MGKGYGDETGLVNFTYLELTTLENTLYLSASSEPSAARMLREPSPTFPIVMSDGRCKLWADVPTESSRPQAAPHAPAASVSARNHKSLSSSV